MHKYDSYIGAAMILLLILAISHPVLSLNSYADNINNINPNNSTVLTGYVECPM